MATKQTNSVTTRAIPVLPLRDLVVFPHMVIPLIVGRERSINAIDHAVTHGHKILCLTQRDAETADPRGHDLYRIGTLAKIVHSIALPDHNVKVLVKGVERRDVICIHDGEYLSAETMAFRDTEPMSESELHSWMTRLRERFEQYAKLSKTIPIDLISAVQSMTDAERVLHSIVAQLALTPVQKQQLLELRRLSQQFEKLCDDVLRENERLHDEKKLHTQVKRHIERNPKEYSLNEQVQAFQRELGDRDDLSLEIQELSEQAKRKALSEEARDRVHKELRRLKKMSPLSPESTVIRSYVEWILALPWGTKTEERFDLALAVSLLDEDHYGLHSVKERIVEYLAVHRLVGKVRGPILCLVGPPGVGKTSLGRSIARAMGRHFVRLSLGGVRDEAEIRGHRRTYIGAMPGKILHALSKTESNNPVFLLDEIDKMSADFRGDPAAALLEVLDPEQNHSFNDHYLDLDYDLSDVMFITTANQLSAIPLPLQDRMEIISLSGYTDEEKVEIAKRYLIPKQRDANGLTSLPLTLSDETLTDLIRHYTKEAGVRGLERDIATICRKLAKQRVEGQLAVRESAKSRRRRSNSQATSKEESYRIEASQLESFLGAAKYRVRTKAHNDMVGLANGLAVTVHGGDLLPTEVTIVPGKGKLLLTGKLGDVMQESAQAAMSYVRSRALSFDLDPQFYQSIDVHVHCPEGAIPKDGPSAGITIATAIVSALLNVPVKQDVAMTGEITLRGRVLSIGGLKEKLLAAVRANVNQVLIPDENERDLKEIPQSALASLKVIPVSQMDDVLRHALDVPLGRSLLISPSEALHWRGVGGNVSTH